MEITTIIFTYQILPPLHGNDSNLIFIHINKNITYLFSQQVSIPSYSESEYNQFLKSEDWSQAETDHLIDLCQRFDLRFIVIHDRWDRAAFRDRSVEDLKERYYSICATLSKVSS